MRHHLSSGFTSVTMLNAPFIGRNAMGNAPRPAPRREKARAATIEEIKRTALVLMREHGTADLKFADIARAMDMTPPALYRYFADRDALLGELIADAYDELGAAVAKA